jgi:hypothetical protein
MNIFSCDHPLCSEPTKLPKLSTKRRIAVVALCLAALLVANFVLVRCFFKPDHEGYAGETWEPWIRMPWGYYMNTPSVFAYLPIWAVLCLPAFFCRRAHTALGWGAFALLVLLIFWAMYLVASAFHIAPAG